MTCITLPQDTPAACHLLRKTRLAKEEKFYRLTSPPENPKIYPSETTNIHEAVVFPLLNKTSAVLIIKSVLSPTLKERGWVLRYLGMGLRNKLISYKSLTPGHLVAFTNYSDYGDLLKFYRDKQKVSKHL